MRWIVTVGLAALLWSTSVGTVPAPSGGTTAIAGAGVCAVDNDSQRSSDSDQRWRDAHHAIAVVCGSVWKAAPVHAELSATRIFELARFVSAPDPPAASTPTYLRHTPLLI